MFRTKIKRSGARKRKELATGSDEEPNGSNGVEGVHADKVEAQKVQSSDDQGSNNLVSEPIADEGDALLDEMRRSRRRKEKAKGAMTFSSSTMKASRRVGLDHDVVMATAQQETESHGLLSFDVDKDRRPAASAARKAKIRPNLIIASSVVEDVSMKEDTPSMYSTEMLSSLRKEQKVLLTRRDPAKVDDVEAPDVEMEDVEPKPAGGQNDEPVEEVHEEEEEEFIPLHSQMLQRRRRKNRVTFGMDGHKHELDKSAEVVEDKPSDDDDNEENKRWEEELMRRGGHHAVPTTQTSSRAGKKHDYPTRKKISCVSIDSLLMKLDRSVEAATFESEREERELARIDAELAIVEHNLKSQREELLISSEEFEYFQVMEDFVKGLSFCLREKVVEIEAKETEMLAKCSQMASLQSDAMRRALRARVMRAVGSNHIDKADVWGYNSLDIDSNTPIPNDGATPSPDHFSEPYAPLDTPHGDTRENLFGDAIDEISSLDRVYDRFQEWKAKFPAAYKNSFCDLAVEKLYAPYVRAELLYWDPFSVAQPTQGPAKAWSLHNFEWFRILSQHNGNASTGGTELDSPLLYQVRQFVVGKTQVAVEHYFDPSSSLQTQSLVALLEALDRHNFVEPLKSVLDVLFSKVLEAFVASASSAVLLAVDALTAAADDNIRRAGQHEVERFSTLLDNLLTLFVALPKNSPTLQDLGFKSLMRVLRLLLEYLVLCQRQSKSFFVPLATQVPYQLAGSSFLLQVLTSAAHEQELKQVMAQLEPFLPQ